MATDKDRAAFEERKREFISRAEAERQKRAEREAAAEYNGQLWTVQIAYMRDHAVGLVTYGRVPEGAAEKFHKEHPESHMRLEPMIILGDKTHVRQQVCKMANTDSLLLLVEGAPKAEPISPGIYKL